MTFIKQGNEMNESEVATMVGELIRKQILTHLDDREIKNFFVKLYSWEIKQLCKWVNKTGYELKDEARIVKIAYQLKLVKDLEVWQEAGHLVDKLRQEEEVDRDEIVDFIQNKWFKEIKKHAAIMQMKELHERAHVVAV